MGVMTAAAKIIWVEKLSRQQLIEVVEHLFNPKGLTSEQIDNKLLMFCANCPNPMAAMDLVVDSGGPSTPIELVDAALACAPRHPAFAAASELDPSHPLRRMRVR